MMFARSLLLSLALAVACCAVATPCAWAEFDEKQAAQAGEDSLGGWGGFPWYDSRAEGSKIRYTPVRSFEAPPAPQQWQASNSTQSTWWTDFLEWLGNLFSGLWQFAGDFRFLLVIAVVVLVLILAFALRYFRMGQLGFGASGAPKSTTRKAKAEIDRIEALPFKVAPPVGDLLSEAQRRYAEGDYRGAVIYYYSYQLVELDKFQKIRLSRGKTNRQYLREIRQRKELASILENTMIAFEEVFFGDHDLSRARFEECWSLCSDFQRSVPT